MFDCSFARRIWDWLAGLRSLNFFIKDVEDFKKILLMNWSSQAKAVIHACIAASIHLIWYARNQTRFEDKCISWKHCVSKIKALAKVAGNNTLKASNGSIPNFSFLKHLDISIHPKGTVRTIDVLWIPPLIGWLKCNVDGVAVGNPKVAACGGIYRTSQPLTL